MDKTTDKPIGPREEPNIWEQKWTFLALLLMYVAQGIVTFLPSALETTMAHEVQRCSSEAEKRQVQTYLKIALWPFSFKLIFAPIVDYFALPCFPQRFHRRGWIIVTGLFTAGMLCMLSLSWDLVDPGEECPNGAALLAFLFPIVTLACISDIALDAIAVIALAGKNIGWVGVTQVAGGGFGKEIGNTLLLSGEKLGFSTPQILFALGMLVLFANFIIWKVQEKTAVETGPTGMLLRKAYTTMYDILCNRRTLMLGALLFMFQAGIYSATDSALDKKNRGYSKPDVLFTGLAIELPVGILAVLGTTKLYAEKPGPLRKLIWALPLLYLAGFFRFLSYFMVPYVDGQHYPDGITCQHGGCEPWVFPFRSIMTAIALFLRTPTEMLILAHLSRATPMHCAGTFQTAMRTLWNLGDTAAASIVNPVRSGLSEASKSQQCTGESDLYGKTFVNGTERFCGNFNCSMLNNQRTTGFCNPWADGYTQTALLTFLLGLLVYLFFRKFVNFMDVTNKEYDPRNEKERLAMCPRAAFAADEDVDIEDVELSKVGEAHYTALE